MKRKLVISALSVMLVLAVKLPIFFDCIFFDYLMN